VAVCLPSLCAALPAAIHLEDVRAACPGLAKAFLKRE